MSNLISGKEAKLAWANNKEIEYMPLNKWNLLGGSTPLSIFDRDDVKFRIKPRTITINSVHHQRKMNNLKTMRDKLNGSIPMGVDENEELLQEQWNQTHAELEALKAEDEQNYVEFKK